MIVFSVLAPLENVMKSILDFFHSTAGLPWAWSIVALTILTRIVLVPLTVRQIHSMQSLQAHAPEMKSNPTEVQGRPREAQRRADEVLQGEQHQPGRVVPAAVGAVPGLHRAVLHAEEQHEAHHRVVAARRPEHLRQGDRALVGLRAARDLCGLADRVDVLHGRDDGQDAAHDHDVPAARLPDGRLEVPDRPDHLLDDDQSVDGRTGARHAPARPETGHAPRCARRTETHVAYSAQGGTGRRQRREGGATTPKPPPAQPRRVKKKGRAKR